MMRIAVDETALWYHGSNQRFDTLRTGSTVTQWRELAEAFSHQPTALCYEDDGTIVHNGREKGYLYRLEGPVALGADIKPHPRTSMDENAEFITNRPFRVYLIAELDETLAK